MTVVATLTENQEDVCRACLLPRYGLQVCGFSMCLSFELVFLLAGEKVWSARHLPAVEKPFYTHHR
jgi:hypothetical protein